MKMYTKNELIKCCLQNRVPDPKRIKRNTIRTVFNELKHKFILNYHTRLLNAIVATFPDILTPKDLQYPKERMTTPLHEIARNIPQAIPKSILTEELKCYQNIYCDTLASLATPDKKIGYHHTWKLCSIDALKIKNKNGDIPISHWLREITLSEILLNIPATLIELEFLYQRSTFHASCIEKDFQELIPSIERIPAEKWVKLSKNDHDLTELLLHIQNIKPSGKKTNPFSKPLAIETITKAIKLKSDIQKQNKRIKDSLSILPSH
jgi:hypothetical protein